MAKRSLGYVQLQWTCPHCGSKNPGPEKLCVNCGAPQPEEVKFEQAAQEKLIRDEKVIEKVKRGPDIHCAYCNTRNPAQATVCSQCGADLQEGRARTSGQVLGAHRKRAVPDVACPYCGTLNPATALKCSQCGGAIASSPKKPTQPAAKPAVKVGPWVYALVGVVILACVVFAFLASRTEDMIGQVADVSWSRSIEIMELGPVEYEDWREDIPEDAEIVACTPKLHHVQDTPSDNSREVCGTPYTVDQGSGFGEVVQDCEYEVFVDSCTYIVDEWQPVDEISLTGNDFNVTWPELQLSANQQAGEEVEQYKIVFNSDGERYVYTTDDAEEFAQFEIGSRWVLKVNAFNAVTEVEPAQ